MSYKKNQPHQNQAQNRDKAPQIVAAQYKGPLPPANQFRDYNDTLPGAADRIMQQMEREQENRFKNDERIAIINNNIEKHDHIEKMTGMICGAILCLTITIIGAFLVLKGHDVTGGTVLTLDLVGLAGVFVYGARKVKNQEEAEK